jgi:hydrogenase maturation factor
MTGMAVDTPVGVLAADLATASLAMARRFSAGATLWCVAPAWPEHAHHVAVEFVHPVIMGKRALPAVAVPDADPVPYLRTLARSGDLLLAVGRTDQAAVGESMRRARVWGLESVWIGAGRRPVAGAADHVLWLEGTGGDDVACYTGRFVLLYHLLWELTHVCFEHPGLLKDAEAMCGDEVCITCSDAAQVGEVVTVDPGGDVMVRTSDGQSLVDATLIDAVQIGDLLLIHAGTAVERVADGES